ncbi:hypothetical protein [Taibaiella soli]|uniref:Outer membrane protein beta-barrel domain-containing protein n=1 Tax=Taibaiella soli TaxID=1649169 RepID=A0A2W2B6U0_9BACT|nr:hypothetical protein [Taibaiella soli]PZF71939.1 hypothetical protein DN068_15635 [Taibaiella soli]
MNRNLLQTLILLLLPVLNFAQSLSDGLYFGVNVNPGLMYNPQAYFPGGEFSTTSGCKVGYYGPNGIVGGFTGIQYTHFKYGAGYHGEDGTQSLDFLELPIGMKVLAGPARGAKFYIEPAISVCVLVAAHFSSNSQSPYAYPTKDNRGDCTAVNVKPSLGWGFHINAGANAAIVIGWQLSTMLGDTYHVMSAPSGNSHTTMAMQLGYEYHLSDLRIGRDQRRRPKSNYFHDVRY